MSTSNLLYYIELDYHYHDSHALLQAWRATLSHWNLTGIFDQRDLSTDASGKALLTARQQLLQHQEANVLGVISKLKANHLRVQAAFPASAMDAKQFARFNRDVCTLLNYPDLKFTVLPALTKPNDYWSTRLTEVPNSPSFGNPNAVHPELHYYHYTKNLAPHVYQTLQAQVKERGISFTTLALNLLYDRINKLTHDSIFRVDLALINRLPLVPYLGDRAGYASSTVTLPLIAPQADTLAERSFELDKQLRQDSIHLTKNDLPLLNLLCSSSSEPGVIFTSTLEQGLSDQPFFINPPDFIYCNGNLPAADFYCQIWEAHNECYLRWSVAKEYVVVEDIHHHFEAYVDDFVKLSRHPTLWLAETPLVVVAKPVQAQTDLDKLIAQTPGLQALKRIPDELPDGTPTHPALLSLKRFGATLAALLLSLKVNGLPNAHPPAPTIDQLKPGMTSEDAKALYDKHIEESVDYHKNPGGEPLKLYNEMGQNITNVVGELGMQAFTEPTHQSIKDLIGQMNKFGEDIVKNEGGPAAMASGAALSDNAAKLAKEIPMGQTENPAVKALHDLNSKLDDLAAAAQEHAGVSMNDLQAKKIADAAKVLGNSGGDAASAAGAGNAGSGGGTLIDKQFADYFKI